MKLAAESRLHTAQPSLSRQMRDLEQEVGAALFARSVRGVELTPAGRAFLDHARLALTQAEAAAEAARRAARPAKAIFSVGFLTGQEAAWLAPATRILSDQLPKIEIRVSSGFSVTLAEDLKQGRVDIAFLRHEPDPDLAFKLVLREPLVAILPRDHRLAVAKTFDPRSLVSETFIGISEIPARPARRGQWLSQTIGRQGRASFRDRQFRHGDVAGDVRAGRRAPADFHRGLFAPVHRQPPPQGRAANGRSHDRLPQGQCLADSEDFPVTDRRIDRPYAALSRQIARYPGPLLGQADIAAATRPLSSAASAPSRAWTAIPW